MVFHGSRLVFHRAERRRREARHETYITPKLVTTRRSILGPPAEGRPGPSEYDDDDEDDDGDDDGEKVLYIAVICCSSLYNSFRQFSFPS